MQRSGRILTVSLNPAVDVTYLVDNFQPGREHNALKVLRSAGGKANKVARVTTALGHKAIATGFSGGPTGRFIEEALRNQGVKDELTEWAGRELETDAEILDAAQALMESGPLIVAASLGPRGLLLVSPEGSWRATPPWVTPVNPVGSGDSMVAGFAIGLLEGRPAEEILRLAVACGTANAMTRGIAEVDIGVVAQIVRRVRVERLI